jgi:hypothetical protein
MLMFRDQPPLLRRTFLKSLGAGVGGLLAASSCGDAHAAETLQLSAQHQAAVQRRRRIVVQYDPQDLYGLDFAVEPAPCRFGENLVRVSLTPAAPGAQDTQVALEKLEVHARFS